MQVEILPPETFSSAEDQESRLHIRPLGWLGALLALSTVLGALALSLAFLFSGTLLAAAALTWAWPLVFSPSFTQWVFGADRLSFGKVFLLLLAAGAVIKMLRARGFSYRRQSWQRK